MCDDAEVTPSISEPFKEALHLHSVLASPERRPRPAC